MIKHKREYTYVSTTVDPATNRQDWQKALQVSNVLFKTNSVYGMFNTVRSLEAFQASIGQGDSFQRMVNLGNLPTQVKVKISPHPVKGFGLEMDVIRVKDLYDNFINNINDKGGSYVK